jgi:hypothetical protein
MSPWLKKLLHRGKSFVNLAQDVQSLDQRLQIIEAFLKEQEKRGKRWDVAMLIFSLLAGLLLSIAMPFLLGH